jgi:hypothetical protein
VERLLIPKCTNADSRGDASARPSSQKRVIIQWDAQVLAQLRDGQMSQCFRSLV